MIQDTVDGIVMVVLRIRGKRASSSLGRDVLSACSGLCSQDSCGNVTSILRHVGANYLQDSLTEYTCYGQYREPNTIEGIRIIGHSDELTEVVNGMGAD